MRKRDAEVYIFAFLFVYLRESLSFLEVDSGDVAGRSTPRPGNSTGNLLDPEASSTELLSVQSKQHHRHSRTASELLGDR